MSAPFSTHDALSADELVARLIDLPEASGLALDALTRLASIPLLLGMALVSGLRFPAIAVTARGALVAMSWPLPSMRSRPGVRPPTFRSTREPPVGGLLCNPGMNRGPLRRSAG